MRAYYIFISIYNAHNLYINNLLLYSCPLKKLNQDIPFWCKVTNRHKNKIKKMQYDVQTFSIIAVYYELYMALKAV